MSNEVPEANPPLSPEEASAVAMLTPTEIEFIDATILSCARARWQKVAMVVSRTEKNLETRYPRLSYIYYALRIQDLTGRGRLESQGDLDYMRFSEVRLPDDR